ncbi:MAG: MipA/OmpV family protein [Desulfuromonadales bacterium]|nr:MipA/OmpV family protein [Desulfuromonadales bacterium]
MKKVFQRSSLLLIAILFAAMSLSGVAAADGLLDDVGFWADASEEIDEAPGYEDPKDKSREWALSVGVAGGISPDYEGSNDYETGFGPNFAGSWKGILFFKGKTLGANIIREKNFKVGPILSWTSGRDDDDNDKLEGLDDVDSSIEAGGFVTYRKKPLRFRLEARQDVNSGHEGALVELSGGTTLPFGKPLVFVALGTTWASDDYMESFFGVDSKQSANSGLKRYKAESGIKDVNLSITAGHSFTNRWRIGGKAEYKRLVGDAADSPIVDDVDQFMVGIGLSYHFGSKVLSAELE